MSPLRLLYKLMASRRNRELRSLRKWASPERKQCQTISEFILTVRVTSMKQPENVLQQMEDFCKLRYYTKRVAVI